MSARLESLKRLYRGMSEHARKLSGETLKERYAPRPPPAPAPVAAAPVAPQVSDDDMAALSDGLE